MADSETALTAAERVSPAETIVTEIARREGVSPLSLPPLYDVLDSDVCDQLFQPGAESVGTGRPITFEYSGYDVIVHADGHVGLSPMS